MAFTGDFANPCIEVEAETGAVINRCEAYTEIFTANTEDESGTCFAHGLPVRMCDHWAHLAIGEATVLPSIQHVHEAPPPTLPAPPPTDVTRADVAFSHTVAVRVQQVRAKHPFIVHKISLEETWQTHLKSLMALRAPV